MPRRSGDIERLRCVVCRCQITESVNGYSLIPKCVNVRIAHFCSMSCCKKWMESTPNDKKVYHNKTNEGDEDMKVYQGKVKDGKIEVDEPDGTKAVLIFDTVEKPKLSVRQQEGISKAEAKVEAKRQEFLDSITEPAEPLEKDDADAKAEEAMTRIEEAAVARAEEAAVDAKKYRYREDKSCNKIYRQVLGMSLADFARKLKADGVGLKSEAMAIIKNRFMDAGYGRMWESYPKLRYSVRASLFPHGFEIDRKHPTKKDDVDTTKVVKEPKVAVPKTYRPSGLIVDAPSDKPAQQLWPVILSCGVQEYVNTQLAAGVVPDLVITMLCEKISVAGYVPNRNAIGAFVYMRANIDYRTGKHKGGK